MSAAETLAAAYAAGLRVAVEGTDLFIEADCAPPTDLLHAIRRDKVGILSLLRTNETVEVLPAVTTSESPDLYGLTLAELEDAAGEDWAEVRDDPKAPEAFAHALITQRMRERGECPPHWTERCECADCGPVFLWRGIPAQVLGCPWCFNRAEGRPIPRPVAVSCKDCIHLERIDHPHLGHCAKGEPEAIAGLWDTDRRYCERFLPRPQQNHNDQPRPARA